MTGRYIVGSIVNLQDVLTDPNNSNAPVTGAEVTATVFLPDGTQSAASATELGDGIYARQFEATISGWHTYVFGVPAGASGQGAQENTFWVAPVP